MDCNGKLSMEIILWNFYLRFFMKFHGVFICLLRTWNYYGKCRVSWQFRAVFYTEPHGVSTEFPQVDLPWKTFSEETPWDSM